MSRRAKIDGERRPLIMMRAAVNSPAGSSRVLQRINALRKTQTKEDSVLPDRLASHLASRVLSREHGGGRHSFWRGKSDERR
jgi:hypothetical protein